MRKLIAVSNVIAWSGFWVFGWGALSAGPAEAGQMGVALALALALAGLGGLVSVQLCLRMAAGTGLARGHLRAVPGRDRNGGEVS